MHRPSASRISRRILLAIAPLLIALEIPGAVELWHKPDTGMLLRGTEIVSVRQDGPADLAGVRPEDVLLALNGHETDGYPAYQAASFGLRAGDTVELELRRQTENIELELELGKRTPSRRLRDYLATSMGLLFVFLGFITFLRRDDALGRLFYAICNLFALLLLDLPTFPWVWVMTVEELLRTASGLLLPAAFLRFFLIFPEGAGVSGRPRHRWLLAPPLFLALFHVYISLFSVPSDSAFVKQVSLATAILFAVYIVAAIFVFDRKIRRENHWVLWSKLRLALVGMILGILPITLATVARQLWPGNPAPLEEASLLLLPFVPLSFSVALLRTGTIDLAYLTRQSMIALTLALPLVALGALLFLGLAPQLEGIGRGMVYLIAVVTIFGLSFAAMPARRPVARIIDRIFYPGQVELRQRAAKLTAELTGARSPEELAEFLCSHVSEILPARYLCFYRVEEDVLRVLERKGDPQYSNIPATLDPGSSMLRAALSRREPLLVEPELTGPRPFRLDSASQQFLSTTDATILAPLWGRDRPLAMLVVGPALAGEIYGEVALYHFRLLLNQAGISLENAMMHREDLARERIAAEMDLAREIQAQLLPPRDLEGNNFSLSGRMIPCRQVGGDVFDYFELPDQRILLAVADASGKGVPASLLMSSVRAALRETARPFMSCSEVADHLNQQVHGMTAEHHFIACFLAIFDPHNGVLNYCTAGIDPPLWCRPAEDRVESLTRGGPVLGVLPNSHYFDGWIRLHRGDVVAAYSDGIVDEEDENQDSFGLPRFVRELTGKLDQEAKSIRDAVFQAVSEFSTGEATDDKTLLVLKFHQGGSTGTLSAATNL